VTSNLNINFLLRPDVADTIAEAGIVRLGRRLAYADVALLTAGKPDLVAHATGTYALPRT
jgi:acyl-coenzyme A thioesterase PaaI-like protein